ncbi:hypothetical protein GF361_04250 [Candidatus Woesearchaeota archaeon]|nr:hypothetical protein [Candidatus Woesearchaeota archaeon]
MKKYTKILVLIFLLTLAFRLYFAFQTPNLNHEAYYELRQVRSIKETGLPIFQDPLSYEGRTSLFSPIYHYFLALFSFIFPMTWILKIIPNILASSLIIINFLLAKKITRSQNASLFCAFISAFIPIFITETFNTSSIYSLLVPLTFLSLYFFMNIHKKKFLVYFLITAAFLIFIHPYSSLLVLGLIIYIISLSLEQLKSRKQETESVLFLTFLSIWIHLILYKKAFLKHGPYVIWQNIPPAIMSLYFTQTNVLEAIIKIGLIPLIFGVYVIYRYIFKEKDKKIYLLASLALALFFLVWFRLLQPNIAFIFLGTILAVLFAQGYGSFFRYLKTTKLAKHKNKFIVLFILVFIITSVIPSFYFSLEKVKQAPSKTDMQAFNWLKNNTEKDTVIAVSLKEGHILNTITQRKNILDTNFLLAPDPAERFDDLNTIYTSQYKTAAISVLNKYDVKYILFSDSARSEFNIDQLNYLDDECFELIFDNKTKIYRSLCRVEEI